MGQYSVRGRAEQSATLLWQGRNNGKHSGKGRGIKVSKFLLAPLHLSRKCGENMKTADVSVHNLKDQFVPHFHCKLPSVIKSFYMKTFHILQFTKWQPTPVFLLEYPLDTGAWWAIVHGISKSRTRPSN